MAQKPLQLAKFVPVRGNLQNQINSISQKRSTQVDKNLSSEYRNLSIYSPRSPVLGGGSDYVGNGNVLIQKVQRPSPSALKIGIITGH